MKYKIYYCLKWYMNEKTGATQKIDHVGIVKLLTEWKQNNKGEKFNFKVKPDKYKFCGDGEIIVWTNKSKMDTVIMLASFLEKYLILSWQ